MPTSIDFRSFALGLLLGVAAMFAMGAAMQPPAHWDLEFANEDKAYLLNRHTGEYQRLDRTGERGTLQRVGNLERPR